MKIKIITDSCCDLPLFFTQSNTEHLDVIGMPVQLNGKEIIDDLGKSYAHETFYNSLRNGTMPTTSQINAFRFEELFKKYLNQGYDVVYVGFSSGMSGTFNSAHIAKETVLSETPEAGLYTVDTLSASIGLGALVIRAVDLVKSGASTEDIVNWLEAHKFNAQHWFGVDDLNYLKNGGRISAASAIVGSVLNVKPTLIVDHEGKLKPYGNVRGRKKSISFLASKFKEHFSETLTQTVLIGHGNAIDDALTLKAAVEPYAKNAEIIVSELSMTIASHVGPNMLAIAFIGDERE